MISWKEYGIAVNGWLQILGANELAELAKVIFKHPDDFKAHSSSIKLSTELEVSADAQWANSVLCTANSYVKRLLMKDMSIE